LVTLVDYRVIIKLEINNINRSLNIKMVASIVGIWCWIIKIYHISFTLLRPFKRRSRIIAIHLTIKSKVFNCHYFIFPYVLEILIFIIVNDGFLKFNFRLIIFNYFRLLKYFRLSYLQTVLFLLCNLHFVLNFCFDCFLKSVKSLGRCLHTHSFMTL